MTISSINTDFYISGPTAALIDLMPQGEAVRNARNGISILLITKGEASIRIDGNCYHLYEGCVMVLMPFHFISSEVQSPDLAIKYLCFDFDFMADFPLLLPPEESEQFILAPCQQADIDKFTTLSHCYDTILGYYLTQEHPYRLEIVKAQLFTFVSNILFYFSNNTRIINRNRSEKITDNFFRLLHRYHKTERSLSFYADQLCVTTKYLSKVIRRTSGHTVYFWVEEFTVKEAKQLLRTTQVTVSEIAEQLNFANSSFFAKFFRRHAGCSPIEFRQKVNNSSLKSNFR